MHLLPTRLPGILALGGAALAVALTGCSTGSVAAPPGAASRSTAPTSTASPSTPVGNGVGTDPVDEVLARAGRALVASRSFHLRGDLTDGTTPVGLDLRIRGTQGARGSIRLGKDELQVLVIGRTGYFSAGPSFWRSYGGEPAARLMRGKYLKASTGSKAFADFLDLTDPAQIAKQMLPQEGLDRGVRTEVGGVPAREFTDGAGGSYLVAEEGDPVPLKLSGRDGATTIALTFSEYGSAVDLTPPPQAKVVDEARLTG